MEKIENVIVTEKEKVTKGTEKGTVTKGTEKGTVTKAIAKAKANKFVLDNLLSQFSNSSVIAKGMKGQNIDIYKKELFDGMFDAQKKQYRKKLRKIRDGLFVTVLNTDNPATLQKIAKEFIDFYKAIYAVNDFTANSVCSSRTDENTRELCQKALDKLKKYCK